jgi:hypothetical protein
MLSPDTVHCRRFAILKIPLLKQPFSLAVRAVQRHSCMYHTPFFHTCSDVFGFVNPGPDGKHNVHTAKVFNYLFLGVSGFDLSYPQLIDDDLEEAVVLVCIIRLLCTLSSEVWTVFKSVCIHPCVSSCGRFIGKG